MNFDQALIVHVKLSDGAMGTEAEQDDLFELQDDLAAAIEGPGIGFFDGNDFGGGECNLYMYGPDADRLFKAVEPILQRAEVATGGYAVKRYGDINNPDVKEVQVTW